MALPTIYFIYGSMGLSLFFLNHLTNVLSYIYIYIYTHTHTHIYIYTHTHIYIFTTSTLNAYFVQEKKP